jgi:predicted dienelactone hydrolase
MTRLLVALFSLVVVLPAQARDWSAPGPYPVGVRTLTWTKSSVTTGAPRVLATTIWYPTVKRSGTPETLGLRDAKVKKGKFPLIIYSHGTCGSPDESTYLTKTLASWGFVVAAPPHPGNTKADGVSCISADVFVDSAVNRVPDVRFVLDQMLAEAADKASPFAKRIRTSALGISGGSFGGFTTLYTAQQEPRFTAAMANVPGDQGIVSAGPDITIPTMIEGAQNDQVVPFATNAQPLFGKLAGPRYLVKVLSTSHLSFFDTGGTPADIPTDDAHDIILHYAVPFFTKYLKSGRAAGKVITQPISGVELTAEP